MLDIPQRFKQILEKDSFLNGEVIKTVSVFSKIFEDNKLYFFPEYTDHGIQHINSVLKASEEIINDETLEKILTSNDIAILILSILLHDLGMQITFDSFKSLIEGKNDNIKIDVLDNKTWSHLWEDYLDEAKKFNSKQLKSIFGSEFHTFKRPDLNDRLNITEADKLLIGEFIRRNHPRIAHEVALKGLIGKNNEVLDFAKDSDNWIKQLSGIIARSHGMEIRDTFEYLQTLSQYEWAMPYSVNVTFLMVVLRIADYFQFDASRVDTKLLKLKTFESPVSRIEHDKHLSIEFVKPFVKDPETLYVEAKPSDSILFLKLIQLFKSIQYELDISWAILGEIYGKENTKKQPQIKYRRIKSNLDKNGTFANSVTYVPEKVSFEYDSDLAKLLIAPLYGNNPSYGVRELLQNSIDACKEREVEEKKAGNDYDSLIKVSIIEENNLNYFIIEDNGKGMTLSELKNYFLKAGSSFRKSMDWQKKYTTEDGKSEVMRSGRFGVGVLAAFLLGDEIEVETFNINEKYTYSFIAKLDSEQLNVEKKKASQVGTRIKILLERDKLKNLLSSNWLSWYKFKTPKILFYFNGENKIVSNLIDHNNVTIHDHEFFPEIFAKVIWSYSQYPLTTCNGIRINNSYRLVDNQNNSLGDIKATPSIHIIDYNSSLNLNLSRDTINDKLPFEIQLREDIYKDFIAYLLHVNVPISIKGNKLILNKINKTKEHPSGIRMNSYLYTDKGYVIDNVFFTNNFHGKMNKIDIGFNKRELDFDSELLDFKKTDISNYFINVEFSKSISSFSSYLSSLSTVTSGYLQLEKGTRIYHSEILFDDIFKIEKRVFHEIWKNKNVDERKNGWVCWSYFNKELPLFSLDNLLVSISDLLYIKNDTYSRNYYNSYHQNSTIFEKILKKYFENNLIIPYELEDRKKMYPKAFEELEPYMRKYVN